MLKKNSVRIFDYTDFRAYISDYYLAAKAQDRRFSHRYILEKVGATSSGWFADVIKARINLTGTYLMRLAHMLDLDKQESEYFESMVCFAQASSLEDRNRYLERMMSFKQISADLVGKDKFEYYSHWYHAIIRELLFVFDFKGDYRALAKKIRPSITPVQARHSISLLKRLELVKENEHGRLLPTASVLKKDTSFPSQHLATFLRANMQLGMEALESIDKEERDISSLAQVLSEEDFRKAQDELGALRKKLLAWSAKPPFGEKVYQCNFQIFPVSK